MFKKISMIIAVSIVVLWAAAYFLYAPKPVLPASPAGESTVEVGGRQRRYLVVTPARLQAGASVLLVFHSSMSSGGAMRRTVGRLLEGIAQRENAVVVYPDGYEGHFNDCRRVASFSARRLNIDDVGFSRRIIDRLAAEKKIDPERVYALGVSNGGHMALRLALEAPELVKGVAVFAANLPAPDNMDCNVASSPSRFIEFVEGTEDPINPYGGGQVTLFGFGNRGNVLSAQESAQWFADRLGLTAAAPRTRGQEIAGLSARQQDWRSASGHVRLVTIEGGGHTIPQAGSRNMRILGATFQSDAVLESAWQLLAENKHCPDSSR